MSCVINGLTFINLHPPAVSKSAMSMVNTGIRLIVTSMDKALPMVLELATDGIDSIYKMAPMAMLAISFVQASALLVVDLLVNNSNFSSFFMRDPFF